MLRQLWKSVFEHTTIPDYARCPPSPTPSMRAILEADAGDTLSRVKKTLDISLPQLLNICRAFSTDLDNAVLGRPSPLDARPSQLPRLPTGNETGTYLAMDLDDDMVYVGCVTFFGSGLYEVEQVRHVIPEKIKDSDADTFFNFLADVVMEALREAGGLFLSSMHLGVTWNFRPEQNTANHAASATWNKDFSVKEGRDVVNHIQRALDKKGLGIKVISIVNDTISTLVAGTYSISADSLADAPCLASCIMGTNTNAAYLEATSRVAAPFHTYQTLALNTPQTAGWPFSPSYQPASLFPQTPMLNSIPSTPLDHRSRTSTMADSSVDMASTPIFSGTTSSTSSSAIAQQQYPMSDLTIINTEWADMTGVSATIWDEPESGSGPGIYPVGSMYGLPHGDASPRKSWSRRPRQSSLRAQIYRRSLQDDPSQLSDFSFTGEKCNFERLVGAAYLGRILGRILTSLMSSGELFCRVAESLPSKPVALSIRDMIDIESDTTPKLTQVSRVLCNTFHLDASRISVVDRTLVQSLARLVSGRAARLYAAAIAALVTQLHRSYLVRLPGFPIEQLTGMSSGVNERPASSRLSVIEPAPMNDFFQNNANASSDPSQVHAPTPMPAYRESPLSAHVYTEPELMATRQEQDVSRQQGSTKPTFGLPMHASAYWTWTSAHIPTVGLTLPTEEDTSALLSVGDDDMVMPASLAEHFVPLSSSPKQSSISSSPSSNIQSEKSAMALTAAALARLSLAAADQASTYAPPPESASGSSTPSYQSDSRSTESKATSDTRSKHRPRPPPITISRTSSMNTMRHSTQSSQPTSPPNSSNFKSPAAIQEEERPLSATSFWSRSSFSKAAAEAVMSSLGNQTDADNLPRPRARTFSTATQDSATSVKGAYRAVTIAVDGILFREYPDFNTRVRESLTELLGAEASNNIYLVPTDETTGCVGAALVALISTTRRF